MAKQRIFTVAKDLKGLAERFPERVKEESESVLRIIVSRLESEIVSNTPKGVGGGAGLAGSIAGEVFVYGKSVKGVVGTPFAYGEVIEVGRKPGSMPPTAPIELWARRKLGLDADEAKDAAQAIAWKIKHHGTEGAHMFENAWTNLESWISDQLETIPSRVTEKV